MRKKKEHILQTWGQLRAWGLFTAAHITRQEGCGLLRATQEAPLQSTRPTPLAEAGRYHPSPPLDGLDRAKQKASLLSPCGKTR